MPTYAFEGFALDLDRGSLRRQGREIFPVDPAFGVLTAWVSVITNVAQPTEPCRGLLTPLATLGSKAIVTTSDSTTANIAKTVQPLGAL
jgi:hypothetical protein